MSQRPGGVPDYSSAGEWPEAICSQRTGKRPSVAIHLNGVCESASNVDPAKLLVLNSTDAQRAQRNLSTL